MSSSPRSRCWWAYPIVLAALLVAWVAIMTIGGHWGLWATAWPAAVTMTAGSFIAGSTPAGGGAVAFPVFTKALGIEAPVARSFGLMIQSVGMTMASLFIISRRIPVAWRAIRLGLAGGIPGVLVAIYGVVPPDPYPRLLFTVVAVVFAAAMAISHWVLRWSPCPTTAELPAGHGGHWHLLALGFLGGYASGLVGSGIDLLVFIGLTLAFGLHERHAIPTTVIIMAAVSVAGTIALALRGDPTLTSAHPFWLVSVPVVACGAPLGAWAASRTHRDVIVGILLVLITLEAVTTTILIGWSGPSIALGLTVGLASTLYFAWMLHRRHATFRGA